MPLSPPSDMDGSTGTNASRHQPKFRLVAATAMLGSIVAGLGALVIAMLVGLRNVAVMTRIAELSSAASANTTSSPNLLSLLWTSLSQHAFLSLLGFATAMLVLALLLRKIVLHGLRD